jgi:zinc protease
VPDWAALRVAETILCSSSGFTNRLALAVREREGLAYDVGGSITAGAGPIAGPFEIALGVDPKQKDRAVAIVKGELKRFLDEGPTEEELADAKRYLLASQASSWETAEAVGAWLLEARRHGLGYDAAARFHREVSAVGRDEVARTARKRIDLGALVTVVVGPVDKDGKLLEGVQDR